MSEITFLDCTFRDGGYYNAWDFSQALADEYLETMAAAGVDVVELGFRSINNEGFKGAFAYTSDDLLGELHIPSSLRISVMVNGSEVALHDGMRAVLEKLFPVDASESPVDIVRFACHFTDLSLAFPASTLLKKKGYQVCYNIMQIADRTDAEIKGLAKSASEWPIDVLYFADSLGSMNTQRTAAIIELLRKHWKGAIGLHAHDNMGMALQNSLAGLALGVSWVDGTVLGMGRGPGNTKTEELMIEIADKDGRAFSILPLMRLIKNRFQPLQEHFLWGPNPYYYLAGKYGIHPTYIQEMLHDSRYSDEDIISVIHQLRVDGGKKFDRENLVGIRKFYSGSSEGSWAPATVLKGRDVLILGTGNGVVEYKNAIERFIRRYGPEVLALNTKESIIPSLIGFRLACHPARLLADFTKHAQLMEPLIAPISMLPDGVVSSLGGKKLYDFGIKISKGRFEFYRTGASLPVALVIAYALAVATSGEARRIFLAGFDGYPAGDPRNDEMNELLSCYSESERHREIIALTPTTYAIKKMSIFGEFHEETI
ncbi:MAG TPA: aldolase catalytic domain-containing protein [Spirochaetales bacterium]|nr:aldolase catalytic domain-containing protein [Spirochaetales bacterium]HRY53123.1 aldolase catalytic domain-containing protein [Spirochaetia bacterium]HRZ64660.1 aldolase catalytic domain-containing protein [Spirochaetia bacterium]